MKHFLEEIEKNEELKAKVNELGKKTDATTDDFIALAKEYGFDLTEEDFAKLSEQSCKLSEDELEAVAGGTIRPVCGQYEGNGRWA